MIYRLLYLRLPKEHLWRLVKFSNIAYHLPKTLCIFYFTYDMHAWKLVEIVKYLSKYFSEYSAYHQADHQASNMSIQLVLKFNLKLLKKLRGVLEYVTVWCAMSSVTLQYILEGCIHICTITVSSVNQSWKYNTWGNPLCFNFHNRIPTKKGGYCKFVREEGSKYDTQTSWVFPLKSLTTLGGKALVKCWKKTPHISVLHTLLNPPLTPTLPHISKHSSKHPSYCNDCCIGSFQLFAFWVETKNSATGVTSQAITPFSLLWFLAVQPTAQ